MKYQIDPVSSDLVITVDAEEHETLATAQKEDPAFLSDAFMYDFIEPVWTNGLSCSIRPEDVGALTDAPMLCEYNADDGSPQGKFWAFMDCAVRSPLQDFIDYGKARWTYGGKVTDDGNIVDDRGVATVPLRPDASAPRSSHPNKVATHPEPTVTCERCATPLNDKARCTDETCAFEKHVQSCQAGWIGHPDHDPEPDDDTVLLPCTCYGA